MAPCSPTSPGHERAVNVFDATSVRRRRGDGVPAAFHTSARPRHERHLPRGTLVCARFTGEAASDLMVREHVTVFHVSRPVHRSLEARRRRRTSDLRLCVSAGRHCRSLLERFTETFHATILRGYACPIPRRPLPPIPPRYEAGTIATRSGARVEMPGRDRGSASRSCPPVLGEIAPRSQRLRRLPEPAGATAEALATARFAREMGARRRRLHHHRDRQKDLVSGAASRLPALGREALAGIRRSCRSR